MAKKVSAAQAKAQLSALAAEVAHRGQPVVIERHGKPWVALVNLDDLAFLEKARPASGRPGGALALVNAWGEASGEDIDSLVEEIYTQREQDTGRPVELEP